MSPNSYIVLIVDRPAGVSASQPQQTAKHGTLLSVLSSLTCCYYY